MGVLRFLPRCRVSRDGTDGSSGTLGGSGGTGGTDGGGFGDRAMHNSLSAARPSLFIPIDK